MDHKENRFCLPPPPQSIFDYLNGFLIGHYIMKKALSVAVYNHFCDVGIKSRFARPLDIRAIPKEDLSKQSTLEEQDQEEVDDDEDEACDLITSDCKSYQFKKHQQNQNKSQSVQARKEVSRKCSNDSGFDGGTPPKTGAFLSPIVTRVIIEASTHKVHLKKPNTLTFDSTGSSKPLDAIATHLANYLNVPYIRCDCRYLVPKRKKIQHELEQKLLGIDETFSSLDIGMGRSIQASSSIKDTIRPARKPRRCSLQGSLGRLLQGYVGETLEDFIAKLYKRSSYNTAATERSIIFLDRMENLGQNAFDEEDEPLEIQKELLQEILEFFDGKEVELKKPIHSEEPVEQDGKDTLSDKWETVKVNTSNMFFICFGVNDNAAQQTEQKSLSKRSCSGLEFKNLNSTSKAINTQISKNSYSINYSPDFDDFYDEGSENEDEYGFEGLKENKLLHMLLDNQSSPIPKFQDLWGMKDVELKISPEAMEIIANQAIAQRAGADGVRTILEKLLFTVKFEIPGKNIKAVEITEDFLLGKSGPIFHYKSTSFCDEPNWNRMSQDKDEDPSGMTEFEEHILQEMEL